MSAPVNQKVSAQVAEVAREWEAAYQKAPDKITNFIGEAIKNSGKYFVPAAEIAGGGWVATEAGKNAINLIQGNDGSVFKASTSTSDQVIGTAVHSIAALVGAGMAVHGAIKVVANLASDIEKA